MKTLGCTDRDNKRSNSIKTIILLQQNRSLGELCTEKRSDPYYKLSKRLQVCSFIHPDEILQLQKCCLRKKKLENIKGDLVGYSFLNCNFAQIFQ